MNSTYSQNKISENLTRRVLEVTNRGILLLDNSHKIIKYNSHFVKLWKIPVELLHSDKVEELWQFIVNRIVNPQELLEKIIGSSQTITNKDFQEILLQDGRTLACTSKSTYLDNGKIANILSFQEMTHAERIKTELRQEINFYRTIIHTLPDLVWLKDVNGVYLACNKRFEDLFGASETEIIGKTDYDFLDSELADFRRHQDHQVTRKGSLSINEELLTFAKDGHQEFIETTKTLIYDSYDRLLGILSIGHNITDHKKSAEKLQKSEERFALAMRGANDGLWDWNLETDEVYYSPRWKSMLGYTKDELEHVFNTWKMLVHPNDKELVLAKVQDYILNKANSFEIEMRMRHKKGHDVFVLSRAFLVSRNSDGKPVRLVGTHLDITERKKVEAFDDKNAEILEMIATGVRAPKIYDEIALLYESRHPGLRCSILELENGIILHGGAPSLPKEYCQAIHGLKNGPDVGSCGQSTYTGKRVVVENIETAPQWAKIKHIALPYGMRCCWSEPIKNSSGKILGAFGMYYNHPASPNEDESNDLKSAARIAGIVMERDQAQKRIRELAYTDILTGLASRASFYHNVEQSIETYKESEGRFALLYIDLDDFKSVNDSLGHDAGDLLLKEIAHRLKNISRPTDFLARLSGDEFCILVQDVQNESVSALVAQRCLETILQPIEICGRKVTPACSIGIANYPDDGKDLHTLIKAADTSLYTAKEYGKNQYVFYQPEFSQKAEYRFRIEQNFREAVEKKQLSLVYQPQIEMKTGTLIGVEALSRWYHPKLGQVPPTDFIATAERIGMIKPLTEWVLRTACTQAVRWQNDGLPAICMAVNISASHFLDPDFISLIKSIIDETGILPSQLELEITETVVQTNHQNLAIFRALKDIGVLLAVDDFGTGYSSFASLKHLMVDSLKIDKYFIDDMMIDRKSQILIASMIEMGHNLNHKITAEGVETKEQYRLLQQLGCDNSQGYLFSKPVDAAQISQFLQSDIMRIN